MFNQSLLLSNQPHYTSHHLTPLYTTLYHFTADTLLNSWCTPRHHYTDSTLTLCWVHPALQGTTTLLLLNWQHLDTVLSTPCTPGHHYTAPAQLTAPWHCAEYTLHSRAPLHCSSSHTRVRLTHHTEVASPHAHTPGPWDPLATC